MVIAKMNTVLVKHNRVLFGIFSIIIIVSFVWFFTPGLDGSMFFGNNPSSPNAVVGKVFGEKITLADYKAAVNKNALILSAAWGVKPSDPNYREYAQQGAFDICSKLIVAKRMGITASDAEVVARLKTLPAFAPKGTFSQAAYDKYVKEVLNPEGFSAKDLEEAFRDAITIKSLEDEFAKNTISTPGELEEFIRTQLVKYKVRAVKFLAADYSDPAAITEQEMVNFHNANRKLFMSAPLIKGEVIFFNPAKFPPKTQFTAQQVEDYYNRHKDDFKKNNEVLPLASVEKQIKVKLAEDSSKIQAADAAKKFREELYDLTAEAADGAGHLKIFRELAAKKGFQVIQTEFFDSTAQTIGNIGREPALVAALFAANDRYPITKSVKGLSGAYVAAVTGKIPSKEAEFSEVKDQVRKTLAAQKTRVALKEAVDDFALKLSESKNPSADLELMLKGTKGKVEKFNDFTYETQPKDVIERFALELALDTPAGKLSKPQDIPGGKLLVFVDARILPTQEEIAKAKPTFEATFDMQKKLVASTALRSWILNNSQNFMTQKTQEDAE